MFVLSRHQLLAMEPEELAGTMECHGWEVDPERSLADQVDDFDEFLDGFRALEELA